MLGRRLLRIYPQVPLVHNTALGIAIMSYDGTLNFGLLGDYDALPDLDDLAAGPARRDRRARGRGGRPRANAARAPRASRRSRAAPPRRAARRRDRARGGGRRRAAAAVARRRRGRERGRAGRAGRGALPRARGRRSRATARPLSGDQIRRRSAQGNVVLRYPGSRPPAALRELQDELTGPYDAEIAAAGQAVILAGGGRRRRGARLGPAARGALAGGPAAARVRRGVAGRGRARALP